MSSLPIKHKVAFFLSTCCIILYICMVKVEFLSHPTSSKIYGKILLHRKMRINNFLFVVGFTIILWSFSCSITCVSCSSSIIKEFTDTPAKRVILTFLQMRLRFWWMRPNIRTICALQSKTATYFTNFRLHSDTRS